MLENENFAGAPDWMKMYIILTGSRYGHDKRFLWNQLLVHTIMQNPTPINV